MRSKDKSYIGLELSHELLEKLKYEANLKEMSISSLVRVILIEYLNKNDGRFEEK